jgi:uncharacterized metal-binding protein
MPSGKVHTALTLATVSGVIAPYAVVNMNGNEYLYIAGCLTGILIMPDQDVNGGNISDSLIRRVFPPVQWLWRIFWTPYALLVPHRHFISHLPILGTVLRIGYIFLLINLLLFVLRLLWSLFDTVSFIWIWNWSFFFGLCHVDIIHFLADNSIKGKETLESNERY